MALFTKADDMTNEADEYEVKTAMEDNKFDELGIITKNTKVYGDIVADGSLVVDGRVEGNISSEGDLVITGQTVGDVSCAGLYLQGCELNSSINSSKHVIIKEDVTVKGDISCQDISIMGTVLGNVKSSGTVFLRHTAIVNGNISAKAIGIETGAKVNGQIECN